MRDENNTIQLFVDDQGNAMQIPKIDRNKLREMAKSYRKDKSIPLWHRVAGSYWCKLCADQLAGKLPLADLVTDVSLSTQKIYLHNDTVMYISTFKLLCEEYRIRSERDAKDLLIRLIRGGDGCIDERAQIEALGARLESLFSVKH